MRGTDKTCTYAMMRGRMNTQQKHTVINIKRNLGLWMNSVLCASRLQQVMHLLPGELPLDYTWT